MSVKEIPWSQLGLTQPIVFIFSPIALPLGLIVGTMIGGWFTFLPVFQIFVLGVSLDTLFGEDSANPQDEHIAYMETIPIYRWVTFLYVPIQVGMVMWTSHLAGLGKFTALEWIGFTLSSGFIFGTLGITYAHELGHKNDKVEQGLAKILLMTVCYMHFFIEHNKGHHVRVATPNDPASAKRGQSFYAFYPQTVIGSFKSAWNIEKRRLERKGRSVWSPTNQMIGFIIAPLAFASLLVWLNGWIALPFFLIQSIAGFSLLEVVNYIEHYGLERKEVSPGVYEKVTPRHSWNSNRLVSNGYLLMLQRHSDHHAHPLRRYQTLRHFDESPQLPTGYAGMILLALVPPLWRKVMDPKLDALAAEAG